MQTQTVTSWQLIKRCSWLATRLSFFVLATIMIICWAVILGMITYKSGEMGLSPFMLLRKINTDKDLLHGFFLTVYVVLLIVAWCALTGAAIGAVAASYRKLRRS